VQGGAALRRLCHSTRASSGSASDRYKPLREQQRDRVPCESQRALLLTGDKAVERIRAIAPDGVHHIVEVAFGAKIKTDTEVLAQGWFDCDLSIKVAGTRHRGDCATGRDRMRPRTGGTSREAEGRDRGDSIGYRRAESCDAADC
jgi:hypothetical protein